MECQLGVSEIAMNSFECAFTTFTDNCIMLASFETRGMLNSILKMPQNCHP